MPTIEWYAKRHAYRLKSRYTLSDLVQEGHLVALSCRKSFDPAKGKFESYLSRALENHYLQLETDLRRKRRNAPMVDLDLVRDRLVTDGGQSRAELRMELESTKRRVSPEGSQLIDVVLKLGTRAVPQYKDATLRVIKFELGVSARQAGRVIQEVKTAMGR